MSEDNTASLAAIRAQARLVDASLQEVARLFDELHRSQLDGGIMTADTAADLVRTHAASVAASTPSEEKDTEAGSQPTAVTSTARAEIRAVLLAVGYNQPAAAELLKRADHEPRSHPTDDEFDATLAGGHALIVEDADTERYGTCQCGKRLGTVSPYISPNAFVPSWQLHLIEVSG
ncbi:hypothetical protein [Streptomyces sp. NPDC047070]|uniref:hypothetical protein n=1 Tax=Streptomyces sp. NPDC047070 TaxID=3154923 RepID=UPI0034541810